MEEMPADIVLKEHLSTRKSQSLLILLSKTSSKTKNKLCQDVQDLEHSPSLQQTSIWIDCTDCSLLYPNMPICQMPSLKSKLIMEVPKLYKNLGKVCIFIAFQVEATMQLNQSATRSGKDCHEL